MGVQCLIQGLGVASSFRRAWGRGERARCVCVCLCVCVFVCLVVCLFAR